MQDDQGDSQGPLPEGAEPEHGGADAGRTDGNGPGQAWTDRTESTDAPGETAAPSPGSGPVYGRPAFGQPGGSGEAGSYGYSQGGDDGPPGSYAQPSGSYVPPASYGQPTGHGGYGSYPGYGQQGGFAQPGYLPQPSTRARRRRTFLTYLTVAVVAAAASAGLTAYALGGSPNATPSATGSHRATGVVPGGGPATGVSGATLRSVVNKVRPGLVDIASNLAYQGSQAAATGMIISSDGLVLTNNHVINGTTQLFATVLGTHQRFAARWVGYDATDDVAVIKLIGARNLRTVPLGNSNTVKIGDHVIAIGNAYGADRNPAYTGSITGLNRTITASDSGAATKETLHDMLQTNAGIVAGDSGGPLVNTSGRVIGMDTAASTSTFGPATQSVGFAIPINRALRIARQIIAGQSSATIQIGSTGFLGVLVPSRAASQATSPRVQRQRQISEDLGVADGTAPPATAACLPTDLTAGIPSQVAPATSGALILGQLCGTPADKAGIVAGDVITSVGGRKVTSPEDLTTVMTGFKPGQAVKVVWVDTAGRTRTASLVLISAPPH